MCFALAARLAKHSGQEHIAAVLPLSPPTALGLRPSRLTDRRVVRDIEHSSHAWDDSFAPLTTLDPVRCGFPFASSLTAPFDPSNLARSYQFPSLPLDILVVIVYVGYAHLTACVRERESG